MGPQNGPHWHGNPPWDGRQPGGRRAPGGMWPPGPPPPPPRWPRRRLIPVLAVLVVVAAAVIVLPVVLSADEDTGISSRAPAGTGAEAEPGTPTATRPPRPDDRNPAAVAVALRGLDPCLLADVGVARSRGVANPATIPTGPHSCLLVAGADYHPGDVGLEVAVGAFSDQSDRYWGAPVTIGGAKAYEYREDTGPAAMCQLIVPVSFTRAIEFAYDYPGQTDLCPIVRQYAEAAVAKLREPDTAALDPATRPLSAWDGCAFVARLLDRDAREYDYRPDGDVDPFSGCRTSRSGEDGSGPGLVVRYDEPPELTGQVRQVGGKTVAYEELGTHCRATWDQGSSGNPTFAATIIELTAENCAVAAPWVALAITLADERPDDADTQAQRPLLFAPEDNDTGALGACADFAVTGGQEDCEPYREVVLPRSPDDILTAAGSDRDVQCAVFEEAVAAVFGAEFTPITWGSHCYFVDTAHVVSIRVDVDAAHPPADYGTRKDLWVERTETEIAGKAAVTFWTTRGNGYDIYLSPHDDLSRAGNVHIGVEAMMAERGAVLAPDELTLDQAQADRADQVITRVVQEYFD